jgi:hypothetical protein
VKAEPDKVPLSFEEDASRSNKIAYCLEMAEGMEAEAIELKARAREANRAAWQFRRKAADLEKSLKGTRE